MILNISQHIRSSWPVTWIALLFLIPYFKSYQNVEIAQSEMGLDTFSKIRAEIPAGVNRPDSPEMDVTGNLTKDEASYRAEKQNARASPAVSS
jgi:hypothetical protein